MSPHDLATGLGFKRFFTTAGVHPYDELEWEKRESKIANPMTGEVVFEQKEVEFPSSWSVNARW